MGHGAGAKDAQVDEPKRSAVGRLLTSACPPERRKREGIPWGGRRTALGGPPQGALLAPSSTREEGEIAGNGGAGKYVNNMMKISKFLISCNYSSQY